MIRKITNADREIYLQLATEFYESDAVLHNIPAEHISGTFEEMTTSDRYAEGYFFEVDHSIAGYALLAKTYSQEAGGEVLWIEEIYIRPEFRSRGLGREFFQYLEDNKSDRVKRIRLEVEEDNALAVSLYERLGYERLEYDQMIKDF